MHLQVSVFLTSQKSISIFVCCEFLFGGFFNTKFKIQQTNKQITVYYIKSWSDENLLQVILFLI